MSDDDLIPDTRPMTARQIMAVAICVFCNALDGFDVLAITFIAPVLAKGWSLSPVHLGTLISVGVLAMGVGSLVMGPFADRLGRRPVVLFSLALMTAGMFGAATAADYIQLMSWRVLTGLGVGGLLPTISALAGEHANARRRPLAIALLTIGYPAGGLVGGLIAAWLLGDGRWQWVMAIGGIATCGALILSWRFLPESMQFLGASGRRLPARQDIGARLSGASMEIRRQAAREPTGRYLDLFRSSMRWKTLAAGLAYLGHIAVFFYAVGWLPSIVATMGFGVSQAAGVAALMSAGGMVGAVTLGWIVPERHVPWASAVVVVVTVITVAIFGTLRPDLTMLRLSALAMGFFAYAGVAGLYATLVMIYPASVRVSGIGFSLAIGRIGAVLAPICTGVLIQADYSRAAVSAIMSSPGLVSATLLVALAMMIGRTTGSAAARSARH